MSRTEPSEHALVQFRKQGDENRRLYLKYYPPLLWEGSCPTENNAGCSRSEQRGGEPSESCLSHSTSQATTLPLSTGADLTKDQPLPPPTVLTWHPGRDTWWDSRLSFHFCSGLPLPAPWTPTPTCPSCSPGVREALSTSGLTLGIWGRETTSTMA